MTTWSPCREGGPLKYTAGRRRSGSVLIALAVLAGITLGGCRTVEGSLDLERALEQAGYTEVDVSPFSGSLSHLEVSLVPASEEGGPEGQADQAAGIVWTVFPLRFEHLTVEVRTSGGRVAQPYSYDEMTTRFGPRRPSLDRREMRDEVAKVAVGVTAALVGAAVLVVAGSAVAVALMVRSHRRRAAAGPPPWPPGPPSPA